MITDKETAEKFMYVLNLKIQALGCKGKYTCDSEYEVKDYFN